MRVTLRACIAMGLALLFAGCSSVSVNTDYDPSADFSGYDTYMWIDSDDEATDGLTNSRITSSLDAVMQQRGFTRVESGADLAIGYKVTTDQRTSYSTVSTGWGGRYRYGWGGGMGMGMSTTTQSTWDVGTLIVGLFDVDTEGMIWTGSASADIKDGGTPQERQDRVDNAIGKLMADFPPGQ